MFKLIFFYALFISIHDPEYATHTDFVVKEGTSTFKVHKEGSSAEIAISMSDDPTSTEVLRLRLVHDEIELTFQEKGRPVTTTMAGAKLETTMNLSRPIDYEKNEIVTKDGTVTKYTISNEVIEFSTP